MFQAIFFHTILRARVTSHAARFQKDLLLVPGLPWYFHEAVRTIPGLFQAAWFLSVSLRRTQPQRDMRWLLERLTNMMMAGEEKKPKGEYVTMRMLAPTLHYGSQLIIEINAALESFSVIRTEALLLDGSKSPTYLKEGLDALKKVLPHTKRVEFPGLGMRFMEYR